MRNPDFARGPGLARILLLSHERKPTVEKHMGIFSRLRQDKTLNQATPLKIDHPAIQHLRAEVTARLIAQSRDTGDHSNAFQQRVRQLREQGTPLRMQDLIDHLKRQMRLEQRRHSH
ncbi:hypothetical protein [Motiliproteus sediminis]|uniref:hypothetical protein n=1 Tax=Motiliproteus sediminis TaxID=1468178 RepID=UPI001AEFFBF5|nr:hypothetical protein [Motiliproteus sediminis]